MIVTRSAPETREGAASWEESHAHPCHATARRGPYAPSPGAKRVPDQCVRLRAFSGAVRTGDRAVTGFPQ